MKRPRWVQSRKGQDGRFSSEGFSWPSKSEAEVIVSSRSCQVAKGPLYTMQYNAGLGGQALRHELMNWQSARKGVMSSSCEASSRSIQLQDASSCLLREFVWDQCTVLILAWKPLPVMAIVGE